MEIARKVRIRLNSGKNDCFGYMYSYETFLSENQEEPKIPKFYKFNEPKEDLSHSKFRYEIQDGKEVLIIQSIMNYD